MKTMKAMKGVKAMKAVTKHLTTPRLPAAFTPAALTPNPHPTHHPSHGLMGCRGGPPPPPHWPWPFWPSLPCLLSLFHRVYLLCSGLGWNLQVGSSMPSIQSCFWAASLLQGYPSSREIFPLAKVIEKHRFGRFWV